MGRRSQSPALASSSSSSPNSSPGNNLRPSSSLDSFHKNNNSNNNHNSDPKLFHILQKLTTGGGGSQSNNNNNNNQQIHPYSPAKQVVDVLLSRHREYRRKNSTTLLSSVESILTTLKQQNQNQQHQGRKQRRPSNSYNNSFQKKIIVGGGTGVSQTIGQRQQQEQQVQSNKDTHSDKQTTTTPSSPPNKRKRDDISTSTSNNNNTNDGNKGSENNNNNNDQIDKEEDEYEKEAQRHDAARNNLIQTPAYGGTSMLNANLRNRYKDVQRERDIVTRKKVEEEEAAAAAVEENALQSISEDVNPVADTSTQETSATSSTSSSNTTKTPTSTPAKKKKKKLGRSNSSQNFQNLSSSSSDPSSSTITAPSPRPKERYTDLGGMSNTLTEIRELIEYPLSHPELFTHLGIHPPRGVLLRGPPGCGKTHLANAIAGQLNCTYFRISAPEIVSGMSGESEGRIRDLFTTASRNAPSVIFMDEIDAIAPKRGGDGSGGGRGMEKRMVAQLLTCMDSLAPDNNKNGAAVMVLAATNRPDSLDSALRRAGRFDREICLGVPDEAGREGILRVMTKEMRLSGDIDFKVLARKTPGYVGADVRSLTKEAGVIAINRIFKKMLIAGESIGLVSELLGQKQSDNSTSKNDTTNNEMMDIDSNKETDNENNGNSLEKSNDMTRVPEKVVEDDHSIVQDIHSITPLTSAQLDPLFVTMDDFIAAIPHVQPSSKREGFATVPDVSWENIGALKCIREELTLNVLEPITSPEKFQELGLPLPAGVLLYGPPGCGKTLLAKAIANESGANFISVKGPELLDKYVGESERAVRVVFERARSSSPCIVFFDELDSLCPKRGSDSGSGGGGVSERVVNQLLTEMDGLDKRRSVFVIAATNRPELIDPAMLRPGRLDKLLYVPLPSPDDRSSILKANASNVKLAPDVDLDLIAHSPRADGYSGADCSALLREAGLAVLRDDSLARNSRSTGCVVTKTAEATEPTIQQGPLQITMKHFDYAFDHVMPSVSKRDQAKYDKMRDRMARARTRGSIGEQKEQSTTDSQPSNETENMGEKK